MKERQENIAVKKDKGKNESQESKNDRKKETLVIAHILDAIKNVVTL